ncbi:M23 family metallopeptidase [Bifidobacterium callitrichos]|uniref:Peptidase M23 n=1 Tax=Bifidobacterium callitrichos DSM 23973 TaxID=1437609 RepID=A0A087AD22_9BIFI|nr:M23 family metallopeptidase [Bifidobacterium callitrichos]KFI56672.1 peptidase M23 [Bifidobacterium callitrichos DSM 23973]
MGPRRRLMAAMLTATGMMTLMMTTIPAGEIALANAASSGMSSGNGDDNGDDVGGSMGACRVGMAWPLEAPVAVAPFDAPDSPWLAGHRGIDLEAQEGDRLIAPARGVIAFAGQVAGKQVVSIRTDDGLILTFEPASTDLPVGTEVTRGEPFGQVAVASDHCHDGCLHWGVRRGRRDYLDPQPLTGRRRIGLKPAVLPSGWLQSGTKH